ncbi:MAG TPA: hypothetical protein VKR80_07430 [Candidatus Limnocylindria bacterium]|nr:hypothetical protein [Candidatus Limnocylindria bacterium]
MAAQSNRFVNVSFTGDRQGSESFAAASNPTSIAMDQVLTLNTGDNTITVPTALGFTVSAVTIVKPGAGPITLKGSGGDVGVVLAGADVDSISLDPSQSSFILHLPISVRAATVRMIWT